MCSLKPQFAELYKIISQKTDCHIQPQQVAKQFKMLVIIFLSEKFGGTDRGSVQQILQWD